MMDLDIFNFAKIKTKTIWGEEIFLVSGREDSSSVVNSLNSKFRDKTLFDLAKEYGPKLLGEKCPTSNAFPLLVKHLHAKDKLSVQVHPSSTTSKNDEAKTEMWMSIGRSKSYIGFKDGIDKKQFISSFTDSNASNYLQEIELNDNEMVLVESGQVHSLCEGDVFEVSQSSNTTYRLYDWGRDGRKLNIDKGVSAINFNLSSPTIEKEEIKCPFFRCRFCPNGLDVLTNKNTFTLIYMIDYDSCLLIPADIGDEHIRYNKKCIAVTLI